MKKSLLLVLMGIYTGNAIAAVSQQPLFSHENIHQEVTIDQDKVNLAKTIIPRDKWQCLYEALFFLDKRNMLNEKNILLFVNETCLKDTDSKIISLKNIPITEILKLYKNGKIEDIRMKLVERKDFYQHKEFSPITLFILGTLGGIALTDEKLKKQNLSFVTAPFSTLLLSSLVPFALGYIPFAYALYIIFDENRSIREWEAQMNKIDDMIDKVEKIQKEANE